MEEPAPSVSHFVHVLHSYRLVIALSIVCTALAYLVIALAVYLFSPSQRVVSLPFRLDFSGATAGTYPNGKKFSTNDITNLPILLSVYHSNHLERYSSFSPFARSIYLIERNAAYEQIQNEYQARLADPKLSPVDRDRVEKEFQAKLEGVNKNEYAINYVMNDETRHIPDALARKVLADTLAEWARYAAAQEKVLSYDIPVLSPAFVEGAEPLEPNLIASVQILRSKITQVLTNLNAIGDLPGVNLLRTHDGMSLEEIRIRIEDMQRFRVEPLTTTVQMSGLVGNQATATHFVESQLEYDQRQLQGLQQKMQAIQQTLTAYAQAMGQHTPTAEQAGKPPEQQRAQGGETVMPQITDTFLDRLVQLTNLGADQKYRQKLTEELKSASLQIIPVQEAVDYDKQLLQSMKSGAPRTPAATADYVRNEIASTKNELRQMIARMNEIYQGVSATLNPSSQLYSVTSSPVTSMQRGISLQRLALYGVLVLLIALPVIVVFCLLHNRVREEEATEEFLRQEKTLTSAETLP